MLHPELIDFAGLKVSITNIIPGEIDVSDARVLFQKLTDDEQILRVQSLIRQIQKSNVLHLDGVQRHVATVDGQISNSLVVNEFGEVL